MSLCPKRRAVAFLLAMVCSALPSVHGVPELEIDHATPGVISVHTADAQPGQRLILEASGDLRGWREIAQFKEALQSYAPNDAPGSELGLYRLASRPTNANDDWTNQLDLDQDGFIARPDGSGLAGAPVAKFAIVLEGGQQRVYFQDTDRYPYHYHFATARLQGFVGMPFLEFSDISLRRDGQRVLLGSVVLAPDDNLHEAAIDFVGNDPYPADQVVTWFETVRSRIVASGGDPWRFIYVPTFEQRATAQQNAALFQERGIIVDSFTRWADGAACYSEGWALGKLVFVSAAEIPAAYGDGRLTNLDILVTDAVPAEIPLVAGVISLEPATPNSHVALLAQSSNLPFAYVSETDLLADIASWDGQEVLFVIGGDCEPTLQNVEGLLTPAQRQEILDSKRVQIDIQPREISGTFHLPVAGLTPADTRFAGGKAANFGFLRRAIPDSSPDPAIAFTFDLWDAYLAQIVAGGETLGQTIDNILAPHTFPPDVATLRADLAAIRDLVKDGADFSATQKSAILAALGGFDDTRKIRFRSSTNVEDSDQFNGAGLYDSFSGCVGDDTDGDSDGPSCCDPSKTKERGVFRAMRKVYASFYNENAFIERLRLGVDEAEAGMAVLVHYSFPDEIEVANGVATLEVGRPADGPRFVAAEIVSQAGADSVANPDTDAAPEVVRATYQDLPGTAELEIVAQSTLVPPGGHVMAWPADYVELLDLLDQVALAYQNYFPSKQTFTLDFEFKSVDGGGIIVKQVRAVPNPAPVAPPVIE